MGFATHQFGAYGTSKSPVQKQFLPTLELYGAHLLARLYPKVKKIFTSVPLTTFFCIDWQLVLHWLKQNYFTLPSKEAALLLISNIRYGIWFSSHRLAFSVQ